MTNKQIVSAQRVLRRLEGTPLKVFREDGQVCWQVTYDNETYNALLDIVATVANTSIQDNYSKPTIYEPIMDYHRDKI